MPKVYLACFGNPAMRKARAAFAAEFMATAGFELLGEFTFDTIDAAASESAAGSSNIVVMCASDADYETSAEQFARAFKSLSPGKILVLAGRPENIMDKLRQAGMDAFIHTKSDAIELLSSLQQKLFTDKPTS